jgi:aspartate racemase
MKTLGLIGGMSWFSTAVYYKTINKLINEQLGGIHSAKLILYSLNFNDYKVLQDKDDWKQIEIMFSDMAKKIEIAGADCLVMCTNTPHLIADKIIQKIKIPLIHIAEETAKEIVRQKITKVGLLGTKFTMENSFFRDKLSLVGIESVMPGREDRDFIHSSIMKDLTKGIYKIEVKDKYLKIIEQLCREGAQGIIFGCTEISLLLNPSECNVQVFDTTTIHSKAAVDFALSEN